MCRNIKTLHHFKPPATHEEIHASALQFVRKLSGMNKPSKLNQAVFEQAVEQIADITHRLLHDLEAHGPPRSRETERQKAIERGQKREEQLRARVLKTLA